MPVRLLTFAPVVLVALTCAAGCDDGDTTRITAELNGPSRFVNRLVSVEPAVISPQFLPGPFCAPLLPFQMHFNLVVRTDRDLFLRRMHFQFVDDAGTRTLPVPTPSSPAVPIPAVPGIPVPGMLPFDNVAVTRTSSFNVFLNFDCGVRPRGRLFIDVDAVDSSGAPEIMQTSVRVGN
jgi:hypothetical protein